MRFVLSKMPIGEAMVFKNTSNMQQPFIFEHVK